MTGLNADPTADPRVARHRCLTLALTLPAGPTGTPEVTRGFRPQVGPWTATLPVHHGRPVRQGTSPLADPACLGLHIVASMRS